MPLNKETNQPNLKKEKEFFGSKAQEEYNFPGSKENSKVFHGRKHFYLFFTESESN